MQLTWIEIEPPPNTRGKSYKSGDYAIKPIGKSGRYYLARGDETLVRGISVDKCKEAAQGLVDATPEGPGELGGEQAAEAQRQQAEPPEETPAPFVPGAAIPASIPTTPPDKPTADTAGAASPGDSEPPTSQGKPLVEVLDEPTDGPQIVIGDEPIDDETDAANATAECLQNVVTEMYWTHGKNFLKLPNADELLKDAGVVKEAITAAMLKIADREFVRRVREAIEGPATTLEWTGPTEERSHAASWHVWTTACKQLRVVRTVPDHEGEAPCYRVSLSKITNFEKDHPTHVWTVTDHHHRSLETAIEAAEELFRTRREQRGPVESNRVAIVKAAKNLGLDVPPQAQNSYNNNDQSKPNPEENVMFVTEEVARKFFVDAGINAETVKEWSSKRLALKLNDEALELDDPEDDGNKKLFHDRLSWLAKGKEIKIGAEPAAKAAKRAAKETETPKGKKGAKAKTNGKPDGAMDDFGYPIDSNHAKVNAALQKARKPLSFAEIVEKTGLSRSQVRYSHLNELVAKKKVAKTDDGWVVK